MHNRSFTPGISIGRYSLSDLPDFDIVALFSSSFFGFPPWYVQFIGSPQWVDESFSQVFLVSMKERIFWIFSQFWFVYDFLHPCFFFPHSFSVFSFNFFFYLFCLGRLMQEEKHIKLSARHDLSAPSSLSGAAKRARPGPATDGFDRRARVVRGPPYRPE